MEYVWKGDNKLCIPGMVKIMPGGMVDIDEGTLKIPGVVKLIGEGKLIVKEQVAAPEAAPVEVATEELPAEVTEEPQRPNKKNRR